MKSECLYIDNVDVYLQFGVYVTDGGYDDLLSLPPLKKVDANDWQEMDGIEADLESPVLDSREVTIKFASNRGIDAYYSFLEMLSDRAVHTFYCAEIGRTFRLRLVGHTSFKILQLLGILSAKFADDYPLEGYSYEPPTGGGVARDEAYWVDDRPTTDYGIRILSGSLSEIMRGGNVKTGLLRNIPSQSGASYDSWVKVTYKSKDVKLSCLLRATNLAEMWRNYYAFLHDLTLPNERMLWVDALSDEFTFFYKSSKVTDYQYLGKVWLKFDLTIELTSGYRNDDAILVTESDVPIYTEDYKNAIDMQVYS